MFRKTALALAATAVLGTAALAPASASAHPVLGGHFYGPHFVGRHFGPGFGLGVAAGIVGAGIVADGCYRRVAVDTPYGPEFRFVNVCY